MKNDFTHLVLTNPLWLILGLLIYFILSLIKVHILWDIQPKIYHNPQITNVFKDYFRLFFRAIFKDKRLIKATFKYLFHYDEKNFPILKNAETKAIRKRLNVLDGLTTFLKPYLIFAFIWTVLEFWIARKMCFDESKIFFGEIQTLLAFIERIPLVKFLQNNKGVIFLFYGIICVLIPFLYDREDSTKKVKKYFSNTLIYLSLLANISFFGIKTGKTTADKSIELSNLQTEIVAIHDSIYKTLVVRIELNDLRDSLKHDNDLYKVEVDRLDSLIKKTSNLKIDSSLRVDLQIRLAKYIKEIETSSTLENFFINDQQKGRRESVSSYFSTYYKANFTYSGYASYMKDKYSWNKATGTTVLRDVKAIVAQEANVTTTFEKKLEKILGSVFDYGFDASINEIFTGLNIGTHKTLKKVVSVILSENYKKMVIEKAIQVLNSIKPNIKITKGIFAIRAKSYQTTKETDFEAFSGKNTDSFVREENKSLEESIKRKINSFDIYLPDNSEIMRRLGVSTKNEAIDLLNYKSNIGYNNGFYFDKRIDLGENIKKMERKAYFKVFTTNFYSFDIKQYNNSLKQYNRFLTDQSSNLTLMKAVDITKFVGKCDGSNATICIKCGLPCTFPICLSKNR